MDHKPSEPIHVTGTCQGEELASQKGQEPGRAGKTDVVEALEQDAEGQIRLALMLEDDPGGDLGMARQSGHRFLYRAGEVEPCKLEVAP